METGSINYSCDCGTSYTESIPATGEHSWYLIASGKTNFYACYTCVTASYEEENPNWVAIREATLEENKHVLKQSILKEQRLDTVNYIYVMVMAHNNGQLILLKIIYMNMTNLYFGPMTKDVVEHLHLKKLA